MSNLDAFVTQDCVEFRKKVIANLETKHPYVFSIINAFFSGKKNTAGLKVLENGDVAGEYTFHLEGIDVTKVETGVLRSEVNHPFLGVIKPYVVVERAVLEKAIKDQEFLNEPFRAIPNYLPDITLKFLP